MSDMINNCCDAIKPLLEGEFIHKSEFGSWRCGFFATKFVRNGNDVQWDTINTTISHCPFCGAEL
jgi:hypothetical protein